MKTPKIMKCKKGLLMDFPLIVVFMFVMAIIIVFVHSFYTPLAEGLSSKLGVEESEQVLQKGQDTINGFDSIFTLMFILLAMGLIISSFLIDTHPVFFFLILILIIAMIIVGALLSNVFDTMSDTGILANETATFQQTNFILDHYVLFLMITIFIAIIVFYAKSRMG